MKAPRPTRIMLVDDTEANRYATMRVLTYAGFTVQQCQNGTRALKAAQENPPDLILLDVNLPDVNGFEVCRRLKENEITRPVPVIFLSAIYEADKGKEYAAQFNAERFLSQPISATELIQAIEEVLAKRISQSA